MTEKNMSTNKKITREDIENGLVKSYNTTPEAERLRAEYFVSNLIALNFNEYKAYKATFKNNKSANSCVSKYIRKPLVQKILKEKMQELCKKNNIESEEIIKEITNIAKSDIKNYIEIKENKTRVKTLEEIGDYSKCIRRVQINERLIENDGNTKIIDRNIVFEFYDKLKALELLLKRMGEIRDTTVILDANQVQTLNIGQISNNYFALLGR